MRFARIAAAGAVALGLVMAGATGASAAGAKDMPVPSPPPSQVANSAGLADLNSSVTHLNRATTSLKRATALLNKAVKAVERGNEARAGELARKAENAGAVASALAASSAGYLDIAVSLHEQAAQRILDEGAAPVDSPSWRRANVRLTLSAELWRVTVTRAHDAESRYCDALTVPGESVFCPSIVA